MGDKNERLVIPVDHVDDEDEEEPEMGEEGEYEPDDRDYRKCWQRLYDMAPKPEKKAKVPLPKLEERDIEKLKEQVRLLQGRSPLKKKKPPPPICWMDLPENPPKTNRTADGRHRYIRHKLEDRKDSEEDVFSSRCLL